MLNFPLYSEIRLGIFTVEKKKLNTIVFLACAVRSQQHVYLSRECPGKTGNIFRWGLIVTGVMIQRCSSFSLNLSLRLNFLFWSQILRN